MIQKEKRKITFESQWKNKQQEEKFWGFKKEVASNNAEPNPPANFKGLSIVTQKSVPSSKRKCLLLIL